MAAIELKNIAAGDSGSSGKWSECSPGLVESTRPPCLVSHGPDLKADLWAVGGHIFYVSPCGDGLTTQTCTFIELWANVANVCAGDLWLEVWLIRTLWPLNLNCKFNILLSAWKSINSPSETLKNSNFFLKKKANGRTRHNKKKWKKW